MLILGVDPGTAIMGYGVIRVQGNHLSSIAYGSIKTPAGMTAASRLIFIFNQLELIISREQPDRVAIEELFFSRNVTTALGVAQARGVALLAAARAQLPVFEYKPVQVKQAVVGYGRAEKKQVQEMVRVLLSLPAVPKPDDVADALAVAICCAHSVSWEEKR